LDLRKGLAGTGQHCGFASDALPALDRGVDASVSIVLVGIGAAELMRTKQPDIVGTADGAT
jgi:hypothetical protein